MGTCGCAKTESLNYYSTEEYYQKIKKIGSGGFREVYLVMSTITHIQYILKVIEIRNPTKENMDKALNEAKLLKECNHPNIISFREGFKQRLGNRVSLNIITEFCDDGDLQMKIIEQQQNNKHFEETQLIYWLMQICLALKYIHNKNIVHRDIKPSNIFLTKKGYVKLGDFGISKIFYNEKEIQEKIKNQNEEEKQKLKRIQSMRGTALFFSPELIISHTYNEKLDIWALGITFYYLMFFTYPYYGKNKDELFDCIALDRRDSNSEDFKNLYSDDFVKLIEDMLSREETDRPSAEMILEKKIIQERMAPFLKDNNFDEKTVSDFINEYEKKIKINQKIEKKENQKENMEKNIISENIKNIELTKEEIEEKYTEKELKEKYEMNKIMSFVQDLCKKKNI